MKSYRTKKVVLLVLISFAAYYFLFTNFKFIKPALDQITGHGLTSYILSYFIIGTPIFIGTLLINSKTSILKSLGLSAGIFTGIWTSLLFSLPMFIGGLLYFTFNFNIDYENLIAGTLVAGFMEELYFRGFLFGQLFKNTYFGFIASILLGALLFAFGHLYQSQNVAEMIGIFVLTFMGAIFFAWLYVEWNYNLWVPIFTHSLMNLSWSIFEFGGSALGDMKANIFRGLTILLSILFTIQYKKRKGENFRINSKTLFLTKKNR